LVHTNHDGKFKSIPKTESVFTIDLAGAVALLAQAHSGPAPIADLGPHPSGEGRIEIYAGRYGPYVQHAKIRATLPKSIEPEALTLEEALELLNAKALKDAPAKKTTVKKTVKKVAAKKSADKKEPADKVASKKAVTKKPAAKKITKKTTAKKSTQE